jgi:hypothetical protein
MKPICCPLNLNFCIETSRPRTKASRAREFRGMELHEVRHTRRRLAGELEVILAHPVIALLLVEFGHHRKVVDDMRRQARYPKFFAPLGSWRVAIAATRSPAHSRKDGTLA